MSDNEKDYFVPEQLEDDDFEKEKLEDKKLKKLKKINKFESQISDDEGYKSKNINKKKFINIFAIILVIALVIAGGVWYVMPHEKKVSEPEQAAKDFCAYFNSGNWKKVNEFLDLKGYYILGTVLEESEYTKFDAVYKNLEEVDEDYSQYTETIKTVMDIDEDVLNSVAKIQIRLNSIEACNKIQNTDSLYKLRINFDYIYNGQAENLTSVIFVSNASGEYKLVYGEWIQEVLNYYQSIYLLQSNYGY